MDCSCQRRHEGAYLLYIIKKDLGILEFPMMPAILKAR